jgi:hypothetical protein
MHFIAPGQQMLPQTLLKAQQPPPMHFPAAPLTVQPVLSGVIE